MLFKELVEKHKKLKFRKLGIRTREFYEYYLDTHLCYFDEREVEKLKPKDIDEWFDILHLNVSKKRKSFEKEIKVLSIFLNCYKSYFDDDSQFKSPIKKRHFELFGQKIKEEDKIINKDVSVECFYRFCSSLAEPFKTMSIIQYFHALRISEVAAIRIDDIYLDHEEPRNSFLEIKNSLVFSRAKGQRTSFKNGFKNSDSIGTKKQGLFPETFKAIRNYIEQYRPDDFLFKKNENILNYSHIIAMYNKAWTRCGRDDHSGTQILRHGGTRKIYKDTKDLRAAQMLLGDKSQKMLELYTKTSLFNTQNVIKEYYWT